MARAAPPRRHEHSLHSDWFFAGPTGTRAQSPATACRPCSIAGSGFSTCLSEAMFHVKRRDVGTDPIAPRGGSNLFGQSAQSQTKAHSIRRRARRCGRSLRRTGRQAALFSIKAPSLARTAAAHDRAGRIPPPRRHEVSRATQDVAIPKPKPPRSSGPTTVHRGAFLASPARRTQYTRTPNTPHTARQRRVLAPNDPGIRRARPTRPR